MSKGYRRAAAACLLAALSATACGSDAPPSATSIEVWTERWTTGVADVSAELDRVRAAQTGGEPDLIGGACMQLSETLDTNFDALPVPNIELNGLLRKAFDELELGSEDCVEAIRVSDARQLERSITQLRQARASLDAAVLAIQRLS